MIDNRFSEGWDKCEAFIRKQQMLSFESMATIWWTNCEKDLYLHGWLDVVKRLDAISVFMLALQAEVSNEADFLAELARTRHALENRRTDPCLVSIKG